MGGFPYPAAVRLVAYARTNWWQIDGEAAASGVDPFKLPFNRFLNFIYHWCLTHVMPTEELKAQQWLDELFRPLPGSNPDAVSPDTVDEEMALFRAGRQNMS